MAQAVSSAAGVLDTAQLWRELNPTDASQPVHCAVAWSGGLDSTVLVHLLVKLRQRFPRRLTLRTVHVDHHLQSASSAFRAHCMKWARRWQVPLKILDVQVKVGGVSLEEAAREARYAAWKKELRQGEILLIAQHADDQIETVLLALMRGAGPAGLAAMPRAAALGAARLLRPLLQVPRALLHQYALQQQLAWVEDLSNQQLRFDRNYLRAEVLPRLRQRWPAVAQTVARSARHCGTLAAAQAAASVLDLDLAADGADLDITVLRRWPVERQLAVLRAWFARAELRSPETRHLEQILRMLGARIDAHPLLELAEAKVRVHRARLVLDVHPHAFEPHPPRPWRWRRAALELPGGALAVRADPLGDLDLRRLPAELIVHGLASAPGRGRSLRKIFQELELPQWERERLPLLYASDGTYPLAIADLWLHPEVQSHSGTASRGRFVWRSQR